jgi:hypothetical protein
MMIVAELEVYHSRPVAPTRRVALGRMTLPVDPPPGFGGVLLGGVVARNVGYLDPDLLPDLLKLTTQLEHDLTVSQPRLRFRLQRDKVGLQHSTHRLLGEGDELSYEFDDAGGLPAQQVLGAVYAAGQLPVRARAAVMGAVRRAIGWQGPVGPELIAALAGYGKGVSWSAHALSHPVEWALEVLGFDGLPEPSGPSSTPGGEDEHVGADRRPVNGSGAGPDVRRVPERAEPSRREIQRRYRQLLITAHPDHGGRTDTAAQRIADLTEARRILLGGVRLKYER